MIRIQFDFPEEKIEEFDGLMKEVKLKTRKDLINNALTLFQWAVEEKKAGNIIVSLNKETDRVRELVMPSLSSVIPEKPEPVTVREKVKTNFGK